MDRPVIRFATGARARLTRAGERGGAASAALLISSRVGGRRISSAKASSAIELLPCVAIRICLKIR